MKINQTFLAVALLAGFGLALGACGGGSDGSPPPMVAPEPTAYEAGVAAITAATTAAAAQAAFDAVDQTAISGDEAKKLAAVLSTRLADLATAARVAEQKKNLMTAAGVIDTSDLSTQDLVDAARTAIADLRGALTAAADLSDADKAPYQTALDNAVTAVDNAQDGIDTDTRRTNQMTALSNASTTLQTALAALSGTTPTQAQIDAAKTALTALNSAITDAADLTDEEKAPYQREATNASAPIQTAQNARDDADDKAGDKADEDMKKLAAALYTGIGPAPLDGSGDGIRTAVYSGTNDSEITVTYDPDLTQASSTDVVQVLEGDKKTSIAAHRGWQGMKYTAAPTGGGTYEAVVYSNVGKPTAGEKFSAQYPNILDYVTNGEVTIVTSGSDTPASRVGGSGFGQVAGDKKHPLPDPNPGQATVVNVSGTFHGVSGTYSCTPGDQTCLSRKADDGYSLGLLASDGTFTQTGWTFKPGSPDSLLMDTPDANYASYGWWIHTSASGALTASAFTDNKGTPPTGLSIADLRGTATYKGGAAGKYALRSSTGGTNDAGAFTADVELNATFAAEHTVSGTIDNFMGADGKSRDWSVELKEGAMNDEGAITRTAAGDTVWTIGENAADASGEWSGTLQEAGDDGVPAVARGTFYTEYGEAGRMVGGFGANKE